MPLEAGYGLSVVIGIGGAELVTGRGGVGRQVDNGDGDFEILEGPRCPCSGAGHEGRCGEGIAQSQDQPRPGVHGGP